MLDNLEKSPRGEYEITEVLSRYLAMGLIQTNKLNRGVYWLDAGTIENLVEVSQFVRAIQSRQGQLIGSPDEAAYRVGRISFDDFNNLVGALPNSNYREVLSQVIDEQLFY
jgi:glucose-1-phosphate thymidylyltransferase